MEGSQYYWELVLRDGTQIEVPPTAVQVIQRRMGNKEAINLRTRSVPYSEIKDFRQTDKSYGAVPLIDEAARAFKEPIYTETEEHGIKYVGVKATWVKRRVTQERWQNYYSKQMNRKLSEEGGMVLMAYVLPIHSIDLNEVQYCTPEEIAKLDRN